MRIRHPLEAATLALLALAGLSACDTAPQRPAQMDPGDYSYTESYLRWQIGEQMREHGIVGLSIALVDGRNILWSEGFGQADREANTAATGHTVYRTGSVSKLFTATAVMQLAEQGAMELDAPLTDYLPEFSIGSRFADSTPITLRRLMTHHSGLPTNHAQGMWSEQAHAFTDLVQEIQGEQLAFAPGSVLAYSNLGYSLLGHTVQNAAGDDFSRHLAQSLLRPAGMSSAEFSAYPPSGASAAKAYAADKEAAQREYPLRDVPAGGLNASVLDLARFMNLLFNEGRDGKQPLLQASGIAEMWREQNGDVPLDLDQEVGLGWFRSSVPGAGLVVQHGGATLYHRAFVALMPEHKLGVAILANTGSALESMVEIGNKALELMWEAKTGRRLPEAKLLAETPMPDAYATGLDDFVGHFDTLYGFAAVQREGAHLTVSLNGQPLTLRPLDGGRFAIEGRILGLIPAELEQATLARARIAGRDLLLTREDNGRFAVIGERLQPVPIPAAWRKRLGNYRILNAEGATRDWAKSGQVRALIREGLLLVEISGKDGIEQTLVLEPLSDTQLVVRGIGASKGAAVQVVTGQGEELISYSGLLLRREN